METRRDGARKLQGEPRTRIRATAEIPHDAISIFTDGSAEYDGKQKKWTSAGFGLIAVEKGTGSEHGNGEAICEHCGPVRIGDHGAQQLTNNVAELIAFLHALRWARTAPEAADRPIILRYDSKYAALISAGVYKAKKNKSKES